MTETPYAYVLCSNPRSGTTMLCNMLSQTRVAGRPDSFFRVESLPDWSVHWGITEPIDPKSVLFCDLFFSAMLREGQGGTDMFGLRLMGPDLGFACDWLDRRHPGLPDDHARFAAAFGAVKFIHLSRTDKLAEAASYLRAEQTGRWHSHPDGTALEQLPATAAPGYDAAALTRRLIELQDLDRAWHAWFAAQGITPLYLRYETLATAPQETLAEVLGFIGKDPAIAARIIPGTRKLADAINATWIARYRAENGTI